MVTLHYLNNLIGVFTNSYPVLTSPTTASHLSPMKQPIPLRDSLKLMDRLDHRSSPVAFSVTYVTCDRKRKTGGKIVTAEGAILSKHNKLLPQHVRRVDGFGGSKKPASYENATRNIQTPDGTITTIHIRLIKAFNGHPIIW